MKARVIKTGRVIELADEIYDRDGCEYLWEEVELVQDNDWQSFRREAAKDILCAMLGRVERLYTGVFSGKNRLSHHEDFIKLAIEDADELIKQLKKSY